MTPPQTLLNHQVNLLLATLPAARDADVEGVHAARVATRRIRETLPLFAPAAGNNVDRMSRLMRRLARRLGRVRELDVMDEGLARRAARLPSALGAISVVSRVLAQQRLRARRRLVRTLDRLGLHDATQLRVARTAHWWSLFRGSDRWEHLLRTRLFDRASLLEKEMYRATAVYFPNRLHRVRIAAKKLRYSVELAQQSGLFHPDGTLGELKGAQETLGQLHDAQSLLDYAEEFWDDRIDSAQRQIVVDDLLAEISAHHSEYLAQRDRLRAVCRRCREFGAKRSRHLLSAKPLLTVSVVALPAGMLLASGRHR